MRRRRRAMRMSCVQDPNSGHTGCWPRDFVAHRNAAIPIAMIDHGAPIIPRHPLPRDGCASHPAVRHPGGGGVGRAGDAGVHPDERAQRSHVLRGRDHASTLRVEPWPRCRERGPWCATIRCLAPFWSKKNDSVTLRRRESPPSIAGRWTLRSSGHGREVGARLIAHAARLKKHQGAARARDGDVQQVAFRNVAVEPTQQVELMQDRVHAPTVDTGTARPHAWPRCPWPRGWWSR